MGSDALNKSNRPRNVLGWLKWTGLVGICVFFIAFWTWKPSSFDATQVQLPPQCRDFAARFHACQSSHRRLVIACHRTWCASWGYCSPGGGLGSRTRYALTILQRAVDKCIRVEVDAPSNAILTANDAVYEDPLSIVSELLHFRSYGNKVEESRESWKGNTSDWLAIQDNAPFYLHMTPRHWVSPRPNGMPAFDYDPCLFHTLFQPTPKLNRDVKHFHQLLIDQNIKIGIHFRTGDAVAFRHKDGDDTRVTSTDFDKSLDQLVACADVFANQLGIHDSSTTYFLATDNFEVQQVAQQRTNLMTLDLKRHSWRHASDEYDAWLEVLLLSKLNGIVVNELSAKNYKGVGDRISTFARLAAKIGFMDEEKQVYPCQVQ